MKTDELTLFDTQYITPPERRNASLKSIEGTGYIESKTNRIKEFLRSNPGSSSREICLGTRIERTSVVGRLNEMMQRDELDYCGEKYDSSTEKYVTAYRVK